MDAQKIKLSNLDFQIGLPQGENSVVTYFSDIENCNIKI